jgi:peptide/nickel transport system permease protein
MVPALFVVSIVVFLILRLIPGDPAQIILGSTATPATVAGLRNDLGLEKPFVTQYARWLGRAFQGDLGKDYLSGESLTSAIASRLPVTIELVILGQFVSIFISIPLGVLAAAYPSRIPGPVATIVGLFGISVPDFWLGILLVLFFALTLGWLPSDGFVPISSGVLANLKYMILPSITIAASLTAVLTRMTRASVLEVLSREYVRLAILKGLPRSRVLFKHVLRNGIVPVVAVIGMQSGYYLGAAVAIETVFSLPGIGRLALDGVLARNYPVVQASVLTIVVLFMVITLVADIAARKLQPE